MFCPKCKARMSCKQTRDTPSESTTKRRYHCGRCGTRLTTKEAVIFEDDGPMVDTAAAGRRSGAVQVVAKKRSTELADSKEQLANALYTVFEHLTAHR